MWTYLPPTGDYINSQVVSTLAENLTKDEVRVLLEEQDRIRPRSVLRFDLSDMRQTHPENLDNLYFVKDQETKKALDKNTLLKL